MGVIKNAKITSKGQVTIPTEVRTALRLRKGDTVTFEVDEDGKTTLRPVRDKSVFARYAGAFNEGVGRTAKSISEQIQKDRGW